MQCETDKATIDYEVHGEGRPILFLHGWTMARQVEIDVYEKIFATRPGWRRIYPDLPGMGRSTAKAGLKNQDDMLETLLAFIDRVLPPGPFVLAGTSGGGYLARAIAAQRRSRIDGLLLRVPAIIADTARRTLPSFRPLVRDDALMATLNDEERAAIENVLVQKRDYIEALQPKAANAHPAGDRHHGADRPGDPLRSETLRLLLRSGRDGEGLRQADPDRHRPPGHGRRLPRRLDHPGELSARHLRSDRPRRPRLADRTRSLCSAP